MASHDLPPCCYQPAQCGGPHDDCPEEVKVRKHADASFKDCTKAFLEALDSQSPRLVFEDADAFFGYLNSLEGCGDCTPETACANPGAGCYVHVATADDGTCDCHPDPPPDVDCRG